MPILLPESSNWAVRVSRGEHGRVAHLEYAGAPRGPQRWALLADLHLAANPDTAYGEARPLDNMLSAVRQIEAAEADGVIVNGDLAWMDGLPPDYDRAAEVLTPLAKRGPMALAPGNHDRRDHLLRRFEPQALSPEEPPKAITVIDAAEVRFILLDSLYRTDVVPGLLGQAQREWLTAVLDEGARRPTVLFVHHPLGEDDGALLDGDRLLEIVQPRRQVKAIFTAHDHVWRIERRGRLFVIKLPATAFAFDPAERIGWVEAEICACGARLRFHAGGRVEERSLEWRL